MPARNNNSFGGGISAKATTWLQTFSGGERIDRKSTRLNSSHSQISYAVFCLKKKKRSNISSSLSGIILYQKLSISLNPSFRHNSLYILSLVRMVRGNFHKTPRMS